MDVFHAYDTFTINGRGRVFTGRWWKTPDCIERDMQGREVLIEAHPTQNGHPEKLAELLPEPRVFKVRGTERFRPRSRGTDTKFVPNEQCGILV